MWHPAGFTIRLGLPPDNDDEIRAIIGVPVVPLPLKACPPRARTLLRTGATHRAAARRRPQAGQPHPNPWLWLDLGLVWMRARILALVNSATLTVNYGVK